MTNANPKTSFKFSKAQTIFNNNRTFEAIQKYDYYMMEEYGVVLVK